MNMKLSKLIIQIGNQIQQGQKKQNHENPNKYQNRKN